MGAFIAGLVGLSFGLGFFAVQLVVSAYVLAFQQFSYPISIWLWTGIGAAVQGAALACWLRGRA